MNLLLSTILLVQGLPVLSSHHGGSTNWLEGCVATHKALYRGDEKTAAKTLKGMLLYKTTPQAARQLLLSIPNDLKAQRNLFKKISVQCRSHWQKTPKDRANFVVMTCPMVDADWIQKAGKLENPYAAETMPHCGYQLLPKKKK